MPGHVTGVGMPTRLLLPPEPVYLVPSPLVLWLHSPLQPPATYTALSLNNPFSSGHGQRMRAAGEVPFLDQSGTDAEMLIYNHGPSHFIGVGP